MINHLQFRLLFSFLVVLLITLGIIGVILLVFLRTRPVPVEETFNELTVASLETDLVTLQQSLRRQGDVISMRDIRVRLEEARQLLDEFAAATDQRLLLVAANRRG
ncbi:MAG TPA: hypothetical protein VJZ27_04105, partial [Aggregatilineales bacterium]|nr:hypothetical protein [Aggregatilineales bacterium]